MLSKMLSKEIILPTACGIVVAIPISYALHYMISIIIEKRKYKQIPAPPEPNGLKGFILGHIPEFEKIDLEGGSISEYIYQNFKSFNVKTIKLRFFTKTTFVTCDPKVVKEVLIDKDFAKGSQMYKFIGFPGGNRLLGNGLVTEVNKDRWKRKRALFNPGFHKQALMMFMKEFNAKGDILIDHLRHLAQNEAKSISLLEKFNRTTLDVIASVAFSMNIDSVSDAENKFNRYIFESIDCMKIFFRDRLINYKPYKRAIVKRYQHVLKFLRDTGRKQIESRIEMLKRGEELPNDILSIILKSHENEDFYLEEMVDEFITFFIAGQETTATALSSAFLELGRNPEVLKKLRDEVDNVLGSKVEIQFEDLPKLKYTGCVFKEALRLYPPVPGVSRICEDDLIIDGLTIPKGSTIQLNTYACARQEEFFDEPLKFKPDRFLKNESGDGVQNYTFFPFSMGPRNCIGQNFAQIEGKILMAKFIQNFDFTLDPNQSFTMINAGTLRPKDGTKCFLKIRS